VGNEASDLPEGNPMRKPIIVAALLALAVLAPPAFAFETDSSTSTNPDGTARYADPDDKPLGGPLGSVTVTPSSNFSSGVSTSTSPGSQGSQQFDWTNPTAGRHTR
jgi:hypothetical protein